ncbi:hypothetical protein [Leptolyngbya sp. FACHB-17]|uniref:hypothetical protein n=1 Tax=unclassified Leptolyngbya TaxID=2650499 RepID=UPI0016804799|nr:hypothetical protein [Leptolyngbya sp. FACHB-17]MBD2079593.1 hypothetical protein [Leptolyngbya sp. FACHB-17]
MSQLSKHSEHHVIWTIGNTRIVDSEPDQGITPTIKAAALGIAAITTAPISPVIAIALAGYAAMKVFESFHFAGTDAADMAREIYKDVNGTEAETVPDGWVPMPQSIDQPTKAISLVEDRPTPVDVPEQAVQPSARPTALSCIVADPYQSRAFFGAQRTGKSYLAAVASKEIHDHLSCKIFHFNLASFGDEDSYYWSHAAESIRGDLSSLDTFEAKDVIKDAIALVKRFYSTQNAILIVDEIAYLGSTSNQHGELLKPLLTLIADKITTLSSSGKKRQQAIWTIAPEFVAGSLTQDAKAVKKLKLCYVSAHPEKTVTWNGQSIGFDWELFRQIKANFEIADPSVVPSGDRICFIGSDWLPVGELPDLKKGTTEIRERLEKSWQASTEDEPNPFDTFINSLSHESQGDLKKFVVWLKNRQGTELTYDQVKDSFAKNNGVNRDKATLNTLIQVAKSKRLIELSSNNKWMVKSI